MAYNSFLSTYKLYISKTPAYIIIHKIDKKLTALLAQDLVLFSSASRCFSYAVVVPYRTSHIYPSLLLYPSIMYDAYMNEHVVCNADARICIYECALAYSR